MKLQEWRGRKSAEDVMENLMSEGILWDNTYISGSTAGFLIIYLMMRIEALEERLAEGINGEETTV